MLTKEEALEEFEEWIDSDDVGNVIWFKSPRAKHVDRVYEQVIKMREFDTPTRALIEQVFELLDSERMEFFRDGQGYADRVKVTRR
jgi:hypothetical protein